MDLDSYFEEDEELVGEDEGCQQGPESTRVELDASRKAALSSCDQQHLSARIIPNTKKKKRPVPPIRINLANCKYDVLRNVQRKLGWKEVGDDDDWEVYWTDMSVGIERIMKLNKTQKINHFNGMLELCRKKSMARNLSKMCKLFPEHYDFMPRTFSLPIDMQELMSDVRARGKKQIYILKPDAGCQGKGIKLVQGKEESIAKAIKEMDLPNAVAQHYLARPLLVNGFKFDMRIYALVLSCDPLRVFIYKEGLARICTEKYTKPKAENLNLTYMHLTNYAVNKHNESFMAGNNALTEAEAAASKWTLEQLADYLQKQGYEWACIWERVKHLVVKSLISVQPIVRNNYRSMLPPDNDGFSCFEILGYDVMLDDELRPWLLEVNHSPSFCIDSPLDQAIKEQLIMDTIELARIDPKLISKAKKAERKATAGRLLEPLHKRKTTPGSASNAQGSSAPSNTACAPTSAAAQPVAMDDAAVLPKEAVQCPHAGMSSSKPKTQEEYEALRQEVIAKREKYEAKHMGSYSRIYPSTNPDLQELYEKLLKGAAELFQSSFQAKAKKALDALGEERKRKQEETENDAMKAEKARARAHRDHLAQMAQERRAKKAEVKAEADALASLQAAQAASLYSTFLGQTGFTPQLEGGLFPSQLAPSSRYPSPSCSFPHFAASVNSGCPVPGMVGNGEGASHFVNTPASGNAGKGLSLLDRVGSYSGGGVPLPANEWGYDVAGAQPPSEVWADSDDPSSGSNAGSRPISARSGCHNPSQHTNKELLTYFRASMPGLRQAHNPHATQLQQQHHHHHHQLHQPGWPIHTHQQQQQQQQAGGPGPHHRHDSSLEIQGPLSSQPVRAVSKKCVEYNPVGEVPLVSFGFSYSEESPSTSRLTMPESTAVHGTNPTMQAPATMALKGLSLQPGSLTSPCGFPAKWPNLQHLQQPGSCGPGAMSSSANKVGERISAMGTGDRPPVPGLLNGPSSGLRSTIPGWGGSQERTLPSSFLSPRSQHSLRPDSSLAHTRPSSSGDVGGFGASRSFSLASYGNSASNYTDKLVPSGSIDSPAHPIYSSANPALAIPAPATLRALIGSSASISPVHPSSAHRYKRTLSAPLRNNSRQADMQQQQQQQQQQHLQQQKSHPATTPPATFNPSALHPIVAPFNSQQLSSAVPTSSLNQPAQALQASASSQQVAPAPPLDPACASPLPTLPCTSTGRPTSVPPAGAARSSTTTVPHATLLPPGMSSTPLELSKTATATLASPTWDTHPPSSQSNAALPPRPPVFSQPPQQNSLPMHTFPPVQPLCPSQPPPQTLSSLLDELHIGPGPGAPQLLQGEEVGTSCAQPQQRHLQQQYYQPHVQQQGSGAGMSPHSLSAARRRPNNEATIEGKHSSFSSAAGAPSLHPGIAAGSSTSKVASPLHPQQPSYAATQGTGASGNGMAFKAKPSECSSHDSQRQQQPLSGAIVYSMLKPGTYESLPAGKGATGSRNSTGLGILGGTDASRGSGSTLKASNSHTAKSMGDALSSSPSLSISGYKVARGS